MTLNGGDIVADILKSHQIPFLFTLCGGHISPILVGAKAKGIRIIDVRDEVNTVFAADAFARLTGIPGIAVVTAGPGLTNTITAMKNAQLAQSPVILLGGAAATVIKGRGSLQDIDQISLVQSVVKQAVTINQNCDIVPVLEDAFRVAQSDTPGPVFVECPIDLLYGEDLVREWYGIKSMNPTDGGLKSKLFRFYLDHQVNKIFACDFDAMEPAPKSIFIPELKPDKVEKVHQALEKSSQPLMIIGSQAMLCQNQTDQLCSAIQTLGIPLYLTGMARGLMGRDHPLHMKHKRSAALAAADLVIIAGMPCDFRLGYGRSINAKATYISVNRNKKDLTLNRKPDIAIHADPFEFVCSLAEHATNRDKKRLPWLQTLRKADTVRENEISAKASIKNRHINPLRFFQVLNEFMSDQSVIVADGGDFVATASYILKPRSPLNWLDPGAFGTLGVGAGFALGAKMSKPDHEIWLIYGDGAAGYSLQEIDSFVRHRIPVIAVIGNDACWTQVARDQVQVLKDDVATELRKTDYHTVAEGYGARGFLLDQQADIKPVLEQARESLKQGIPAVINVIIDKTDFREGSISM